MAAYEKRISAKQFKGIIQSGDGVNLDLSYATEAINCDTTGGLLRPMHDGLELPGETEAPIGTLMRLHRRFMADDSESELFVAAAGNALYYKHPSSLTWTQIADITLQSDDMSSVTYEAYRKYAFTLADDLVAGDYVKLDTEYGVVTVYHGGVETVVTSTPVVVTNATTLPVSEADGAFKYVAGTDGLPAGSYAVSSPDPVDVLLMTNKLDGMICFFGDTKTAERVTTRYKMGVIARHYERAWGADCDGVPDLLVYSAPYNPFDWAQNDEIPEDGAGEISQPSWDGDSFVSLVTYGSYLLAIKHNKVWRILGTNPGEYIMKEQYGGGTAVRDSVAVNGDYVFMLGNKGLSIYDGSSVSDFKSFYLTELFSDSNGLDAFPYRVNYAYLRNACSVMRGKTFCIALTLGSSTINNAVLEYNTTERTFSLRYGVYVKSFLDVNGVTYYTSAQKPNAVFEMDKGAALPLRWVSGYQDFDALNITKSNFNLYIQPTADSNVKLSFAIETEKKIKTKEYLLSTSRSARVKTVRFGCSGRRFRVIITCPERGKEWSLTGGLQLNVELDED